MYLSVTSLNKHYYCLGGIGKLRLRVGFEFSIQLVEVTLLFPLLQFPPPSSSSSLNLMVTNGFALRLGFYECVCVCVGRICAWNPLKGLSIS